MLVTLYGAHHITRWMDFQIFLEENHGQKLVVTSETSKSFWKRSRVKNSSEILRLDEIWGENIRIFACNTTMKHS